MVLAIRGRSTLRDVVRESPEMRDLAQPAQRNRFIALVMSDVAGKWRTRYLVRRIEAKSVLRPPFNYKLDRRSPMIGPNRGSRKLINVIGRGRIRVTKPQGSTGALPHIAKIPLPTGHPVPREIRDVLNIYGTGILPDEARAMVGWLRDAIVNRARGLKRTTVGRRRPRLKVSLSDQQRQELRNPQRNTVRFRNRSAF